MSPDDAPASAILCASADGRLLAHLVDGRIDLRNGLTLAIEAEVGIESAADGTDLALLGEPARLLVASRRDGETRLHAIDPAGPIAIGDSTLRGAHAIAAAVGDHVWMTGPGGAGLVDMTRATPAIAALPMRTAAQAVGTFAGVRFVASTAGVIEEWDPIQRIPVRRFRLGRPALARAVGGNDRQVWFITTTEPERVEVIPLINQGQPTRVELPEPIVRAVAMPVGDALVALAASGAAWVIDLTGRRPLTPVPDLALDDAAWLADGALAVAVRGGGLERLAVGGGGAGRVTTRPARVRPAPSAPSSSWRDALVDWYRGGASERPPGLDDGPLAEVAERLELDEAHGPALALVYAAYLCGDDGVAPAELARALERDWSEALGRGALAASGALRWRRARVRLAAPVRALLDDGEPRLGALVASDAKTPPGQVAVIARGDDLPKLAAWLAPQYGPLLVPNERGLAAPAAFFLEARLRGVAPLVMRPDGRAAVPSPGVAIVADEASARALRIPVIGTWPPG